MTPKDTGYDYKEIVSEEKKASLLAGAYENFGWQEDEEKEKKKFRLRRDRQIVNKTELTRLERHFEACVAEIQTLENKKKSNAALCAWIVGLSGVVLMAAAALVLLCMPSFQSLCIALALSGMACWIVPYFLYRKVKKKYTEKIAKLIGSKYDEIDALCRKGQSLLHR